MNFKSSKILKSVTIGSIFFPCFALAAQFSSKAGVLAWLQGSIVGFFKQLILSISMLAILYCGFLFVTAGGDPQTINKAKQILVYALIGMAVAILANNFQVLMQDIIYN
jgi:hypothetical protein